MDKFSKILFVLIFTQTITMSVMEYQIMNIQRQIPTAVSNDSSHDILNEKIANYITKVNPKIPIDSARLIGDITIRECNGDLQKISVALAVFHTESRFKHRSVSEKGAGGIGQTMPIALAEYQMRTGDSLLNPATLAGNIRLSIWTLDNIKNKYVKRNYPDGIYAMYNGGIAQLKNLKQGKPLAEETLNYIYAVKERQPKIKALLS